MRENRRQRQLVWGSYPELFQEINVGRTKENAWISPSDKDRNCPPPHHNSFATVTCASRNEQFGPVISVHSKAARRPREGNRLGQLVRAALFLPQSWIRITPADTTNFGDRN